MTQALDEKARAATVPVSPRSSSTMSADVRLAVVLDPLLALYRYVVPGGVLTLPLALRPKYPATSAPSASVSSDGAEIHVVLRL
jgi:hypothetical protein